MHSTLELSELDNRIGRLFMAGIPGPRMDSGTQALIRDHALGGIILFARNIQDPMQVAALCRDLQETAMESQGMPLFLAVDQEGGRVARLQAPFTGFPGNSAIGADPLHAGKGPPVRGDHGQGDAPGRPQHGYGARGGRPDG